MLTIDYGYDSGYGDTLQALFKNRYVGVLTNPGQADITTHVNFLWLKSLFDGMGLRTSDIISQRHFLHEFGIEQLTQKLIQNTTPAQAAALLGATARLLAPQHMGQLFKVLVSWHS